MNRKYLWLVFLLCGPLMSCGMMHKHHHGHRYKDKKGCSHAYEKKECCKKKKKECCKKKLEELGADGVESKN